MIAIVSVRCSGTHFLAECLGGASWYQEDPTADVVKLHVRDSEVPKGRKIVIPWRAKELVAQSWLIRGCDMDLFRDAWSALEAVDGFRFDMKTKPFDELEAFIGRPVKRLSHVIRHADRPRPE